MKLFCAPASPFVRKTLMVLHETNQLGDVEIVPASGNVLDAGTIPLNQNPLGKIPVLEAEDGTAIYDSRVICRYLDARASAGLYLTGKDQWDCLTLEATADGIMEAAILMVYEYRIRPQQFQYLGWVDGQWAKAERAIAMLSSRWLGSLSGPFHIGQIAAACALGYCDFRLPERDWRSDNPELAAWYEAFSKRPSFQATVPNP